jgi:hypothetical protein
MASNNWPFETIRDHRNVTTAVELETRIWLFRSGDLPNLRVWLRREEMSPWVGILGVTYEMRLQELEQLLGDDGAL